MTGLLNQIIAKSSVEVCSLFTYGSHGKVIKLPIKDEDDGEDPLVMQRHCVECPGEEPVLQTHHQKRHMRQQDEFCFLAEGSVSAPGGRELEPEANNITPHCRQCCLERRLLKKLL